MKTITGLLAGAALLVSASASAQYYAQASVSGEVLSYGPRGFLLQGPDGNYGIIVTTSTVVTDSWGSLVATGQGYVQPGDYVTATGYPTAPWIMQATRVVNSDIAPQPVYPPYGGIYAPGVATRVGVGRNNVFAPIQQNSTTFNTLPTPGNNSFNILPIPGSTFVNPLGMRSGRR
jgi:hypothetical protein